MVFAHPSHVILQMSYFGKISVRRAAVVLQKRFKAFTYFVHPVKDFGVIFIFTLVRAPGVGLFFHRP